MVEVEYKKENDEAWIAWQCVSLTSVNIYLTGKAGTGKTTFLKRLREHSPKRMAVVAPTGVAAINAGGVTIHSFFQLPFAPYIPGTKFKSDYTMRKEKINIIRTLDMLVIDEISMVRADLLDSIDAALRHYRRNDNPFGGVQLLMIGDLQQLPPVVVESERHIIESNYASPYFFSSHALQQSQYVTIELKKVYRQSDQHFVNLLNKIRENVADRQTLADLNARYVPNFNPSDEEGYIRLTTHNSQADAVNQKKLLSLKGEVVSYECEVSGIFPETSYPAEKVLALKRGAQVMFIKNDHSQEHRYYNGKIGVVEDLTSRSATVRCLYDDVVVTVEYEEWDNTKYVIDKDTNEISEQIEGKFMQIPLRLAWAVTIHKSQGLTFDKAIIDAQMSFAHGQVYVALSRCRTLEGIVLSSPITIDSVISDRAVASFVESQANKVVDNSMMERLKADYSVELVRQLFMFRHITSSAHRILRLFEENCYQTFPKLIAEMKITLDIIASEITGVSDKFLLVCDNAKAQGLDIRQDEAFLDRISKGATYFKTKVQSLLQTLLANTDVSVDRKDVMKPLTELRTQFSKDIDVKLSELTVVAQQGFSVEVYLRARANAIIESERKVVSNTTDEKKKQLSPDVANTRLYNSLVKWRKEKAEELNVVSYQILNQKSIIDISSAMPLTVDELKHVKGIGTVKIRQFGQEILDIVNDYVSQGGVDVKGRQTSLVASSKVKDKVDKIPTIQVSYDLYVRLKSISAVAQERGLKETTIFGHLMKYVAKGELSIEELMGKDRYRTLYSYIDKHADDTVSELFKIMEPQGFLYHEVRVVAEIINPTLLDKI